MIETMTPVNGLLARDSLSQEQRDEMYALLASHFEGVTRAQFEHDLAEKNWVVEIRRDERLLGFSTLLVTEAQIDGRWCTAIYSGDTIVAPEAWGSPALARTWIAAVNHLRAECPSRPCYWLLLTSGFRTYRFLSVFWREYFPRPAVATPAPVQHVLDHLAAMRYGPSFHAADGIVRFPRPQKLRGSLSVVPEGRASNPDIAFFLTRNPRHAHGDELVCLAEISERNLTPAGRRMIA